MGELRAKAAKAPNIPAASFCLILPQLHKPSTQVSDSQGTPDWELAEITARNPLPLRTQPEELGQPLFLWLLGNGFFPCPDLGAGSLEACH